MNLSPLQMFFFLDVGFGLGSAFFYFLLKFGCRSIGIKYVPNRIHLACSIKKALKKKLAGNKQLELVQFIIGDICDVTVLQNVKHMYSFANTFSEQEHNLLSPL